MVSIYKIEEIINMTLKHNHISNNEIRTRMNNMSLEEKKNELKGKLNPFEEADYDNLTKEIEKLESNEHLTNEQKEKIKEYKENIFNYDKRIVRGYDLNKYNDKVPSYDSSEFKKDTNEPVDEHVLIPLPPLETAQVKAQQKINLNENEFDSLYDYFGKEGYKHINAELSNKYGGNLWNNLSNEEQKYYHEKNKERISSIDSAINKCDGLIIPTTLYHGVGSTNLVDIHTRVGEHINFEMFISSSFQKDMARDDYGKDLPNGLKLYCKFLAPKGTKGICANDRNKALTAYWYEHEYLLGRKNSGTVVDIDYDTGEVTILIDE